MRVISVLALGIFLTGCIGVHTSDPSPAPVRPSAPRLRAGFARVDITPPPGAALFGYGPEGKRSVGYRQRLHARVMLLEDARGERIGIVVTELGANSALVHRLVAQQTSAHGLGADRILLAATHTHAGPTHYFGLAYDMLSGDIDYGGFDARWAAELANRIAAAITTAAQDLRPAVARWSAFPLWGVTYNRAFPAYELDQPRWQSEFATPPALTPEQAAIDPTWLLLRVDTRAENSQTYRPAGALSIFALHGTGIPSANRHYDSDLHGLISKQIEHVLSGDTSAVNPSFVHLFAQGSVGDATAMSASNRCALPTPGASIDTSNTLFAAASHDWIDITPDSADACINRSRARMREVADVIVPRFLSEFRRSSPQDSLLSIARAFRTIQPGYEDGFCQVAQVGYPTLAGPPDGMTRYAAAHIRYIREGDVHRGFSLIPWTICQQPKRIFAGALGQQILQLAVQLPVETQLSVVRIGDHALATLPAEATTTAGGRIKDALAQRLGMSRVNVGLIAIANGYIHYLTTREEYQAQRYEGSSTLFGPGSAEAFKNQIVDLGKGLAEGARSPRVTRDGVVTRPSLARRVGWGVEDGPASPPRRITRTLCTNGRAIVDWVDQWPGRVLRARYPLIEVQRATPRGWETVARDDDLDLEVTAIAPSASGYDWSVRWWPTQMPGRIRLRFTARDSMPELTVELSCT